MLSATGPHSLSNHQQMSGAMGCRGALSICFAWSTKTVSSIVKALLRYGRRQAADSIRAGSEQRKTTAGLLIHRQVACGGGVSIPQDSEIFPVFATPHIE